MYCTVGGGSTHFYIRILSVQQNWDGQNGDRGLGGQPSGKKIPTCITTRHLLIRGFAAIKLTPPLPLENPWSLKNGWISEKILIAFNLRPCFRIFIVFFMTTIFGQNVHFEYKRSAIFFRLEMTPCLFWSFSGNSSIFGDTSVPKLCEGDNLTLMLSPLYCRFLLPRI